MKYSADFETTTDENDCRVWAWGVCEIGDPDYFVYDNNIDSLIKFMENSNNSTFYFHNLKFDAIFIISWLFQHGFKHVTNKDDEKSKTFTTLISDKGQFYSIKIIFYNNGKKKKMVKIYDSLKVLPFSVAEIAKAFGLPINKLEIDYKKFRPVGHVLTPKEILYLRNDVQIVANALNTLFSQGLTKMTQASNAFSDYKDVVGELNFKSWFPMPHYDSDVRQCYRGGFTYVNPIYKGKDIKTGLVFDVNSLYPWVMRDCPLPYDEPIFFNGKYEQDELYPLYVQMLTCQFEIKKDHIPTIQLKNNLAFMPTEYITDSGDEEVTMCLTSVDLDLFLKHYEVYDIQYHSGWKFKSATGLFTDYIDKWTQVKIEATETGNKGMRTLSKLMLNALYGKFALNPIVQSKIPYFDDGVVKFTLGEKETRDPVYIPVGAFITAHARYKTITTAQKLYKNFVYADTDSVHLDIELPDSILQMKEKELNSLTTDQLKAHGLDFPDDFIVHPTQLGAWKLESCFHRARFLRAKSYIEDSNHPVTWNRPYLYDPDLLKITCAGMPASCYQYVTWENFQVGATYKGKLQSKQVKGGTILKETEFTIKPIY